MSVILAACVWSMVLGPVTGVAGALRAGTGDLGGSPGADTSRLTVIDETLTATVVQFVRARSGVRGQSDEVLILSGRGPESLRIRPTSDGKTPTIIALAPDWWIIDQSTTLAALASPAPSRRAGTSSPLDPPPAWIDLVDGQRFIGRLAPPPADAPADEQVIRWSHPRLGTLSVELDSLRRLVRPTRETTQEPVGWSESVRTDTAWLSNGDRFDGFIEGISTTDPASPQASTSLLITPAGSPRNTPPTSILLDQFAAVVFANPVKPAAPNTARLWLGDGSILNVESLDIDATSGRVTIASSTLPGEAGKQRGGPSESLELNQLRAVAFEGARLHALTQQPIAESGPVDGRRVAPISIAAPVLDGGPAPLNAEDLILPGPMFVEWTLPPGASRIAGWATLDPAAGAWGDCEVRVSLRPQVGEAREIIRGRVNADTPVLAISAPLNAAATDLLRIEVLPGANGPIQDRIVLKRMLILATRPASNDNPR